MRHTVLTGITRNRLGRHQGQRGYLASRGAPNGTHSSPRPETDAPNGTRSRLPPRTVGRCPPLPPQRAPATTGNRPGRPATLVSHPGQRGRPPSDQAKLRRPRARAPRERRARGGRWERHRERRPGPGSTRASLLEVLERLPQLSCRVHHERPVRSDRLPDRLTAQQQDVERRRRAVHGSRGRERERLPRTRTSPAARPGSAAASAPTVPDPASTYAERVEVSRPRTETVAPGERSRAPARSACA